MELLEVDIAHRLGDFRLEANFTCQATGITALFGRSGAGKTSLVNALAGLLRPERGRIVLRGQTLFDSARGIDLPPERRRLGYVFQEGRLFPHLSVRQNLLYGYRRAPANQRAIGLDRVVGLLGIDALRGPERQQNVAEPVPQSGPGEQGRRNRVALWHFWTERFPAGAARGAACILRCESRGKRVAPDTSDGRISSRLHPRGR